MLPDSIPDPLEGFEGICSAARRWFVPVELVVKLQRLQQRVPFDLSVISAYRTPEEQQALIDAGDRPAAPIDRSTHTSCPATGVDVWPDVEPVRAVKALLASEATLVGFRVGGGGPVDDGGLPIDWNHLDLGPRR